ncbi:tetratricopeptide repeat protein 39C-like isoform X1 [Asterias rubens]|uniref:tetratricopeptide repeat protein 39C-like isoform X1 n=2 Tax=Asterias rubens TaxID=7604 RepID=UPI001455207F|nr:tetratricopeptide repeat protein 39C-like isoform X1 [Asterias rubens]
MAASASSFDSVTGEFGSLAMDDGLHTDDVKLSLVAINLLLNNGFKESEEIFNKYRSYSPLMSAGASFVQFMNAMMTFEDDKMDSALESLKETEKLCSTSEGFMKSLRSKVMRRDSATKNHIHLSVEERITRQIITGDCQLYTALLTFSRSEVSGFLKGGWLIRKGYKIYEKAYKELVNIYQLRGKESPVSGTPITLEENSDAGTENDGDGNGGTEPMMSEVDFKTADYGNLSEETLARLFGGVTFGYGLLQLCISMMPPSLLKVVNLLGFRGNRDFGLRCLQLSSHSQDMKAPLAMLSLLWYHTVVRPFFGLDDHNIQTCIKEAESILKEGEAQYSKSALVMFYQGRVQKLQRNIDKALETYNTALEAARDQREIQLICVYEIGWCNLMMVNWEESMLSFARMKEESKWSKCYYAYLTAVCQGALGQVETAQEIFKEVPELAKKKSSSQQMEAFLIRKAHKFKKTMPTSKQCIVMAIEVLYLWRALPNCSPDCLNTMLKECESNQDQNLKAVTCLLKGALNKHLGNKDIAIQCFEDAIVYGAGKHQESFAAPHACVEVGSLLVSKPMTIGRGKALLNRAKDQYKDYDFENRLHMRIHAALQRLKDIE